MNSHLSLADVKKRIEPHFYDTLTEDDYIVSMRNPHELLTWNRLDVAFKLLYLEYKDVCNSFARWIYAEHIRALTLDAFVEPGNSDKCSCDKFIEAFEKNHFDIAKNGFSAQRSLVPLSLNGSIANGAHRLASAIVGNREIACVNINCYDHIYDYNYFYERNVARNCIEIAVSKFVECASNVYIALIWPSAVGKGADIEEIISNIVYRKEIELSANGAHNMLTQLYYSEEWLGDVTNKFKGVDGKYIECFRNLSPVRVFAFQAENLEAVLSIKNRIRNLFGIGKHSIHINDTHNEAIRISRLLFNENSIHFLNYATPYKYVSVYNKISAFAAFMKFNHLTSKRTLIDGGMLLSLFGLRESRDVDFLTLEKTDFAGSFGDFDLHDDQVKYHGEDKCTLICNPIFHLFYNDVKFVSFNQLFRMKQQRAEEKDKYDLALMDAIYSKSTFKEIINRFRQEYYYGKIKFMAKVVEALKSIKMYNIIRSLYRKATR